MKHLLPCYTKAIAIYTIFFLFATNIKAQKPAISFFAPNAACGGTNTNVFITGVNFTGATGVSIGGVPIASFTVNSPSSITALVGSGNTGPIAVTTPNGTATSTNNFTFGSGYAAYAYVSKGDTVDVINTATNKVTATIAVGNPGSSCVSPDGTKVYVSNGFDSTVSVINTATNKVTATITTGLYVEAMCMSPDGSTVYLTGRNNQANQSGYKGKVITINTSTNKVTATLPVGFVYPTGICVSPDGTKLYVGNFGNSISGDTLLSVINTSTNKITATVSVGLGTADVKISPDGSTVYVANQNSNSVSVVNAATNLVTATVPVGNGPGIIAVSPDGTKVYVPNYTDNTVSVINAATDTVTATITVGKGPLGLSASPDGTEVYVPNGNDTTVSIINTATNTVAQFVTVGKNPFLVSIANVPTTCTLPVSIINIAASNKNGAVAVNWQTATEINTSHFNIQQSTDGESFKGIGTVEAIGSGANRYEFIDNNPVNGINYYRLQSVDKDGSSSYSKVVSINFGDKQSFSIVPNPAKDFATISFSKTVDKATIAVYDMTGKAVITQSLNGSANAYKLNTQALTNGVYVIKVNTATGSYNEKLLISK